jgi:hypothetical protein
MVKKVHTWVPKPTIFHDNFRECAEKIHKLLKKSAPPLIPVELEQFSDQTMTIDQAADEDDVVSLLHIEEVSEDPFDDATLVVKICRLCTSCYSEDTELFDIFTTPKLADGVELLIPGMVSIVEKLM